MPTEQVPDRTLLKKVNQKLSRTGMGGQCRVAATIRNGVITLTGQLQFETQRRPVVRAATQVEGVRQVIDQLQIKPAVKRGL